MGTSRHFESLAWYLEHTALDMSLKTKKAVCPEQNRFAPITMDLVSYPQNQKS